MGEKMTVFPVNYGVKKNAYKKTVNGFLPSSVVIPLYLEESGECEPLVNPGDKVTEGQLIAVSKNKSLKSNVNIFSPIPGTVQSIELTIMPRGKTVYGIRIKLQGTFSYLGKKIKPLDIKSFSPASVIKKISNYGIFNSFITNEPKVFSEQLEKARKNTNKLLIVRLFDEDPSRMADQLVTSLFIQQVFTGAELTALGMEADGIVFVGDKDFIESDLIKKHTFQIPVTVLQADSKKYPSTFIREICDNAKKVIKETPFDKINKHDVYTDSTTVFEVYRSLCFDKPVIDKYIHISGDCIPASGFIRVPLGTTIMNLAEHCGGFIKSPAAIIVNGMINGVAAVSLDAPVTKYIKSIRFLPSMQSPDQRQSVCVRCGNCRRVCPRQISPDIIFRHISGGLAASPEYLKSAALCVDCGLCNSVCPARLPLSQSIYNYKSGDINDNQ